MFLPQHPPAMGPRRMRTLHPFVHRELGRAIATGVRPFFPLSAAKSFRYKRRYHLRKVDRIPDGWLVGNPQAAAFLFDVAFRGVESGWRDRLQIERQTVLRRGHG